MEILASTETMVKITILYGFNHNSPLIKEVLHKKNKND